MARDYTPIPFEFEAAKPVWNGAQRPLDADETAAIRRMFAPDGAGGADGKLPLP